MWFGVLQDFVSYELNRKNCRRKKEHWKGIGQTSFRRLHHNRYIDICLSTVEKQNYICIIFKSFAGNDYFWRNFIYLSQSWLRDGFFWNSENAEIRGIGIGIWKARKIPSEKSWKSLNSGDRDQNLKMPRKSRVKNSKIPGIGIRIWKSRKNPEIPGIGIGILKCRKKPSEKSRNLGNRDFFRDIGIFLNFEIFIPGIFYPAIGIFSLDGIFRQCQLWS